MFEPKPKDLPHRIFFPAPIILHGTNEKTLLESALEYLRQPGRVRIEPLYAQKPMPAFKGATCKGSYALGTACGNCERCKWERPEVRWRSLNKD